MAAQVKTLAAAVLINCHDRVSMGKDAANRASATHPGQNGHVVVPAGIAHEPDARIQSCHGTDGNDEPKGPEHRDQGRAQTSKNRLHNGNDRQQAARILNQTYSAIPSDRPDTGYLHIAIAITITVDTDDVYRARRSPRSSHWRVLL